MSTFVSMEASTGPTQCDSYGVQDNSLICQSSGKLKSSNKKYIGIMRLESGHFTAMINDPINKKRRYLGTYDTAEQAASAYDFAAKVMRGTNAKTNFITFDSCNLTPSASLPTLSGSADFNPPPLSKQSNLSSSLFNKPCDPSFLSKQSNLDYPLSSYLLKKPSQKQDNEIFHFGASSTMHSSPCHKFNAKNQDISAAGHPVSTNNFTLPCSIPYTQSFQVPSLPRAFTLNMPLQPFLNITTNAVQENIFTTQSYPNPVFPLINRFLSYEEGLASTPESLSNPMFPSIHNYLPDEEELACTPQSQQCSTTTPYTSMNSTTSAVHENLFTTQSFPKPVFPLIHRFLPHEEQLASIPQSQQHNSTTPYTSNHSTTSAVPETVTTTQILSNPMSPSIHSFLTYEEGLASTPKSLSNPMFPSIHNSLPHEEELASAPESLSNPMFPSIHNYLPHEEELACTPQSQQCSTTTPCTSIHSTTNAVLETISTTPSSPNQICPSKDIFLPHEEQLASISQSRQWSTSIPCITTHSTIGLFNLDMQKGLYENENEQQCIKQYDIEELSSTQLARLCEWSIDSHLYDMPQFQQCSTTNLDMKMGSYENQNEQQCTNSYELEKELDSTQLPDLSKWSTEFFDTPPDADFLLDEITDVTTLPPLANIWD